MQTFRNLSLILASITFISICGCGLYEHVAVVPRWAAAPPLSLTMMQGPYGLNAPPLWRTIHPVTLLLLIITLASNWRTSRRRLLLVSIIGYLLVLIATNVYFVPQLLEILRTPYQPIVNEQLQATAARWQTLSIIRLVFMLVLAGILLSALLKPATHTRTNTSRNPQPI